jgi:hypothetical protein
LATIAESTEPLTNERINVMSDTEIDLDETDEEARTDEISDEALECAASTGNANAGNLTMICTGPMHTFC